VVDVDSGALLGKITGMQRDHGVAFVPDRVRGFISDGGAAQVVVFDLKTLKTIGRVKVKPDADSISYDPASKHVFVFEGDSSTPPAS
jgi:DNA-binding beta-propeller fold protein YncE